MIESWHSTLEFELRSLHKFATRAAARAAVAAWIEDYNHVRRHSALGMRQPGGLRAVPGGKGRRVTAAGPLRGPAKEAAAPPLSLLRPLRVRGRHPGLQGAAHRPAGDGPAGRPGPRGPLRPLGTGKAGRPQPAPARRGRNKDNPRWPRSQNRCLHALRGTPAIRADLALLCAGKPGGGATASVMFAELPSDGFTRRQWWRQCTGATTEGIDLVSSCCRAGALQQLFECAEVARDRCLDSWDG